MVIYLSSHCFEMYSFISWSGFKKKKCFTMCTLYGCPLFVLFFSIYLYVCFVFIKHTTNISHVFSHCYVSKSKKHTRQMLNMADLPHSY